MSDAARKLLQDALALPEVQRLELAAEIIASVDGPPDEGWEGAWLAELDRRVATARERGEQGAEWSAVRARILARIGRA
jgi:putative addiction module component (TIGR02574 family)